MRLFLFACALVASSPQIVLAEPPALTLSETIEHALVRQPLLQAQTARAQATRRRADAAGELPDPQLVAGLENLPLNRPSPWATDADDMTMTTVGLMQEFPNPLRRRSRAQVARLMASGDEAASATLVLRVTRDATLAWIDAWLPQQALALIKPLRAELERSRELSAIGLRSGRTPQAELHAATIAQGLVADRERRTEQDLHAARARLVRWIETAAERPLAAAPPLVDAPSLNAALAALEEHPQLRQAQLAAAAAQAGVELARADYRPDWRVQAMYGYRRPHEDMVSLQFGIDLPLFKARRQEPTLSAALAEADAVQADREALQRELAAELVAAHRAEAALQARLDDYERLLLPAAQARTEAALADYASGNGGLDAVLDARTQALELQLMHLDLLADRLRMQAQLRYLTAETRP